MQPLRILFCSTPVGPLGSGLGGGVELTLRTIALALQQRGHQISLLAPAGSRIDLKLPILEVAGRLQQTAQSQDRESPVELPPESVLAAIWQQAYQRQGQHDLILNFAYDWLPFYLTPFFQCPIAHLVSMGSLSTAMDVAIAQVADAFPGSLGVHSQAQAATFPFALRGPVLSNGLDLSDYPFQPQAQNHLGWMGRLAPEKGLEDAVEAAVRSGVLLRIWGALTDETYWQSIQNRYPNAPIRYEGFLPTDQLAHALGTCRALIMTPKWVEAFGNVAMEALACGVPVIAYRRGGPAEIVREGETGWLVEPDNITGLVEAIARIKALDRIACRQQAEHEFSLQALGDRYEAWFRTLLSEA
jgi:UDP-glucose:tetrahydrobiopterin glucosyltransferase